MARLACVNIPDFALQALERRHPRWRGEPMAVSADVGPQARLTSVSAAAEALGVRPGMRYAEALSIAPDLRADTVAEADITTLAAAAARLLQRYSPEVEPSVDYPGVSWAGIAGLEGLYASAASWAEGVLTALGEIGLRAAVAAGFSKFATYAAAGALDGGFRVFESCAAERAAALATPLAQLQIPEEAYALLAKLGVRSIRGLLRLPREGLLQRFGADVSRLHAWAAGDLWLPLQPRFEHPDPRDRVVLDSPEASAERLLFLIKSRLPGLLSAVAGRGQVLRGLDVGLKPEGQPWQHVQIRPAAPTQDERQILDLLRLRLERCPLSAGIVEIVLRARGVPGRPQRGGLFPDHPGRDLAAGRRALARVRTVMGDRAVVRARITEGHLPEARFAWEPVDEIWAPRPSGPAVLGRVRRIWATPLPLPSELMPDPDVDHAATAHAETRASPAAVRDLRGPYIISGGWWVREVHREYYFLETQRGGVLWVYYDRLRRRWRLYGRVE